MSGMGMAKAGRIGSSLVLLATLAAASFLPRTAQAQETPEECAPTDDIDKHRFLRQLSLDLLGRIPTVDEYAELDGVDSVPESILTRMMSSEEFFTEVRRYHQALLWGTLDGVARIVGPNRLMSLKGGIYYIPSARRRYRGGNVFCVDQEQLLFDTEGRPVPIDPDYRLDPTCETDGCAREGWVLVNPYWDPATQVKVCAFDAQASAMTANGSCVPSERGGAVSDVGCGCGPNLRHCAVQGNLGNDVLIREALAEEPARIFEWVVRAGAPYFDALKTRNTFVNGLTAHYYQEFTGSGIPFAAGLPDLSHIPYDDATWSLIERGELHSGALTSLAYLFRFASNRGRVNRFYTAFLCQPFEPPEGGLPPATDSCSQNPDLSQRCGCATCHTTIEPAAAHWGRFRHTDHFGTLEGDILYNETCANCEEGRCSSYCNKYYVTRDTSNHPDELGAWLGHLQVRAWRTEEEALAIDSGPRALVENPASSQALAQCSARTLAAHLLGRPLSQEEVLAWIPELAVGFESSGYDFKALMTSILNDARYRTIR